VLAATGVASFIVALDALVALDRAEHDPDIDGWRNGGRVLQIHTTAMAEVLGSLTRACLEDSSHLLQDLPQHWQTIEAQSMRAA
jgi:hypothetical protein